MRANKPVVDLRDAPDGQRISQLLFGEDFTAEKTVGAYCLGRTACGYQGWVARAALAENRATSHYVSALASFVYAKPDIKSELRLRLPFGAKVTVSGTDAMFSKTPEGYVFTAHLRQGPIPNFATTAERFIGIPYLWGGRSSLGVDCSGLVQLALHAAGVKAPRDSGPQSEQIGKQLSPEAKLVRSDLVFWNGHVGIMRDADNLLHATGFSMRVMSEPLATVVARIKAQGHGGIATVRRVAL